MGHPEGRTVLAACAGCREVAEEEVGDALRKVCFRMNHGDEDEDGRKDVTEDEAVRHVEAVEGARSAEDADVAFERLADADVVVLRTRVKSVRSVNVDDLGFQIAYH